MNIPVRITRRKLGGILEESQGTLVKLTKCQFCVELYVPGRAANPLEYRFWRPRGDNYYDRWTAFCEVGFRNYAWGQYHILDPRSLPEELRAASKKPKP
uniref:Uncharacterized protein n=1 Tax=viral metagenome TaxID=1070528 RepID=A0A6M3L7T0_9ZZZZ